MLIYHENFWEMILAILVCGISLSHSVPAVLSYHLRCCKNGVCKQGFPKKARPATEIKDDKYPDYRQRSPAESGNTYKIWYKGIEYIIDNRWVVPYNPHMLAIFRCHINIEYVHSIKAIRYHLGYHFKGGE